MNGFCFRLGIICLLAFFSADLTASEKQMDDLVAAFYSELYSQDGQGYEDTQAIAAAILRMGEEQENDSWKVRGLVRLAFIELNYGKWRNDYEEKIAQCETLLKTFPHDIAHAEFQMFRGQMLGTWQDDIPEGIKKLNNAILLAEQLREDEVLARSFSEAGRLYGFSGDRNRMLEYTERANIIGQQIDCDAIKANVLSHLLAVLNDEGQTQRAIELARTMIKFDPYSGRARWVLFNAGEDDAFLETLEQNARQHLDTPNEEMTPVKAEHIATHNMFLATAYRKLEQLKSADKCYQIAFEHYQLSGNRLAKGFSSRMRKIIEIMMIQEDVNRLNILVKKLDSDGHISSARPEWCRYISEAYERHKQPNETIIWLKRFVELTETSRQQEFKNITTAAGDYWDGELQARKQIDVANEQKRKSRIAYYLLTSVVIGALSVISLGYMGLRGTRIQKDKLAKLVDKRTKSLIEANKKSNAANEAKSEFIARVNHEIRNPLTAILGYCELMNLSNMGKDANQKLLISGLSASSRHLLELVDDVLVVSRIENNELESNQHEFDLNDTVWDISKIMADLANEKSLQFECSIAGNCQERLMGDETKLRQILLNLLSNAIKFTDAGKVSAIFKLHVLNDHQANLEVKVSDTGSGISAELQPIIFDKFARGSHQVDGTGLGLHICKKLVEHLGGTIALQTANHGTNFLINVPFEVVKRTKEIAHLNPPHRLKRLDGAGEKILVVDDQENIRDTICLQLQAMGFESKSTVGLENTLDLVANWQPGIVLIDLRMPKDDGFTIQSAIRDQNSKVTIVAMTGDATDRVAQKCKDSGFDAFLTKPFRMQSVREIVNRIVASTEAR